MMEKWECPKCGVQVGREDCYDSYRQCKRCVIAGEVRRQRDLTGERRERRREQTRVAQYKYKYGVTREQYKALTEAAGGRCPICSRELPLVIDHCHETQVVRGAVCADCNKVLGFARDNVATLLAAAEYLSKSFVAQG